jgi:hypothetical protein
MSSLSFIGDETSYLRIPNTNDFNFGTGDFTIEWYQYQTDENSFPRIFQIGTYDNDTSSIGVSIEGGTFYYWTNNSANSVKNLEESEYKNQWVHFAISRSNASTQVFMNGISIYTMEVDNNDFNSEEDLVIANESTPSTEAAFGGYITYFSWVKGVALYTSNFTVSNNYPTLTNDYVLLLKATSFDGTLGNTVDNQNVSTVENVPPNFLLITQPVRPITKPRFTNNSLVFYKQSSLASCGVGSVRNSSIKSRRI